MSRNFFLILIFIGVSVLSIFAQSDKCNLELKFFEYNLKNSKIPVSELDVSVVNLENDKKVNSKVALSSFLFLDRLNGKYKVKIQKSEFKIREKEFELDCNFADKDNNFVVQVYLAAKNNSEVKDEPPSTSSGHFKIADEKNDKNSTNAEKTNSESVKPADENKKQVEPNIATVTVAVEIDEDGNVVSAEPVEGNPEFYDKTVKAVRLSKFAPTYLSGFPVSVTGNIVYNYKK